MGAEVGGENYGCVWVRKRKNEREKVDGGGLFFYPSLLTGEDTQFAGDEERQRSESRATRQGRNGDKSGAGACPATAKFPQLQMLTESRAIPHQKEVPIWLSRYIHRTQRAGGKTPAGTTYQTATY